MNTLDTFFAVCFTVYCQQSGTGIAPACRNQIYCVPLSLSYSYMLAFAEDMLFGGFPFRQLNVCCMREPGSNHRGEGYQPLPTFPAARLCDSPPGARPPQL